MNLIDELNNAIVGDINKSGINIGNILDDNSYDVDDETINHIVNNNKLLIIVANLFYYSNYGFYNFSYVNVINPLEVQDELLSNIKKNKNKREFYTKVFKLANLVIIPTQKIDFNQKSDNSEPLRNYTFLFDKVINKALRQELIDSRTYSMVIEMDDEIRKNGFIENIILYRGFKKYMDFKIGDIIETKGFSSKTSDINIARFFSEKDCCIFLYIYDKELGTPIYDLESISFYGAEAEFLTLPNEMFKITNKYNVFNNSRIYKVYECLHLGFHSVKPKINIVNDFKLDNYQKLLPLFVEHLNNGWNLILYDGDLNENNYTLFKDEDSLFYETYMESNNYAGKEIKHYGFMKMLQALLELSNNLKVMLIYNILEKYDKQTKSHHYDNVVDVDEFYIIDDGEGEETVRGIEILLNYLDKISNNEVKVNAVHELVDTVIKVDAVYEPLYNKYTLNK